MANTARPCRELARSIIEGPVALSEYERYHTTSDIAKDKARTLPGIICRHGVEDM